jgi:hypothetical protein
MWRDRIKQILRWGWKGIQVWNALSALGLTSLLRAVFKGVVAEWSWYDQLFLFGGIFLLILGVLAWLNPLLTQLVSPLNSGRQKAPIPQTKTTAHLIKNKLLFVVQHIAEARQRTPRGSDITIHLPFSFLSVINVDELYNTLLKLQNDDKILRIKYFPKYLLSTFSDEFTEKMLDEHILDYADPNRRQFRVELNKKRFDDFVQRLGIVNV